MNQAFCIIEPVYESSGTITDYRIVETNPAFVKMTGLTHPESYSVQELEPHLGEEWFRKFEDVVKKGRSVRFEGSVYHFSQKLWYDVSAFPADLKDNTVAVLFINLSAKKKIQEHFKKRLEEKVKLRTAELEESRDFVKRITETTPDVFYIINLEESRLTYVSSAIIQFGYEPEKLYSLGNDVFNEIVHPEDLQPRINNLEQLLSMKPDEIRESEFRIKDASGEWHFIYNRTTVFRFSDNKQPSEILGIAQDITTKKLAERAYMQEKYRNTELERMNEVMDNFVYAAAHDLKAPVSNLLMLNEIIDKTTDYKRKMELQEKYKTIISTLQKTIEGLVNVISVEKINILAIKTIKLEDILNHVTSELSEKLNDVNPEIRSDFSKCPAIEYIEPYLLCIFRNLLSNSLKFRSKFRPLKIEITSERKDQHCLLTFSDNGSGIDLENYGGDLFKPFKRFDFSSEGTGIGLHLVKNMVTRNGGKIQVRSVVESGTAFLIYLNEYKS